MDLQLADETVLVTGAGQGLGRAIGLAFAEEGARVAFHYNSSAEGARKAAAEVNAAGGAALAVHADLRDDAAVEAAAEQVESALGPISVLVNNAAATQRKRFLDTTAQDWQAQVDVTVTGMLRVTHAVARRMAERDRGSIVSLLGDSGRVGESGILVTATTRSSTVGLTKSLAKELARHQIRANAVSIALGQTDSLDAHTGMREGAGDERLRKILAQYPLRSRDLITNRHAGNPLECRAGVALWQPERRRLTFWSGTQVPHIVRNMLADLLGLAEGSITVIAPDVGGGFGVKSVLYPEDVALCLMALAMPGTPVKWVEDRSEHLMAATHARDHRYLMKAGFTQEGDLLALEADVSCNVGAYSVYPWTAGIEPLMAGGLLSGPYRLANYHCTVRGVATNTARAGPYRGVARPASVFAMESVLDSAARALGLSGAQIRRRNLIRPTDIPYRLPSRLVDDSGHYAACLDKAIELAGFDDQAHRNEQQRRITAGQPRLGVGFACYNELTGLGRAASAGPRMPFRTGHDACTVRINPDGTVTTFSGVTSQGQGLETTIAQVVADAVGVCYDAVEVRIGHTDESLWGFGAFSSRQSVIGGGAARLAGQAVRDRALRLAAGLLDAKADELVLSGGQIFVNGDERPSLGLAEVGRVAYLESNRLPAGIEPGLQETRFDPIRGAFAAGAQVITIEIDPETAELRILTWTCVEDAGRIIHPLIVDGQIAGSIAQGIGGALYEHLIYDADGNLSTGSLLDYLMPTSAEDPEVVIGHVANPAANPLGVRGVGEGTLGPAAALASAVGDALGVAVDRLPITPGDLWQLMQQGLTQ